MIPFSKEREIKYSISILVLYRINACSEKQRRGSVLFEYLPSRGEIDFNESDTKDSFNSKGQFPGQLLLIQVFGLAFEVWNEC